MGVRVSQVKSYQTFQAPQKISFTLHFDTSFILDGVKRTVIHQVWNERKCDVLGSKHTLTPPTYFQGGQDPQLPGSTPLNIVKRRIGVSKLAQKSSKPSVIHRKWSRPTLSNSFQCFWPVTVPPGTMWLSDADFSPNIWNLTVPFVSDPIRQISKFGTSPWTKKIKTNSRQK